MYGIWLVLCFITLCWHSNDTYIDLHHCYNSHKFIGHHMSSLLNQLILLFLILCLSVFLCMPYIDMMIWTHHCHSATCSISQWRWWTNSSLPSVRKYLTHTQESQAFRKWFLKYPNVNIQQKDLKRNIYIYSTHSIAKSLIQIQKKCTVTNATYCHVTCRRPACHPPACRSVWIL